MDTVTSRQLPEKLNPTFSKGPGPEVGWLASEKSGPRLPSEKAGTRLPPVEPEVEQPAAALMAVAGMEWLRTRPGGCCTQILRLQGLIFRMATLDLTSGLTSRMATSALTLLTVPLVDCGVRILPLHHALAILGEGWRVGSSGLREFV